MTRASFTARSVAHVRAHLDRPATPGADLDGAERLVADLGLPMPLQLNPSLYGYLEARTRWFDDQLVGAVPAQVVIIGAGYDDRALRFKAPGRRFVEIDHPVTQEDKRERLDRLGIDTSGIDFVPVDLSQAEPRLGDVLDAHASTLVICEAVLPYLAPARVRAVLASASTFPGDPLRLAADLPVQPTTVIGYVALGLMRATTTLSGETIRTMLSMDDVPALLSGAGWTVDELLTGRQLGVPSAASSTAYVAATR